VTGPTTSTRSTDPMLDGRLAVIDQPRAIRVWAEERRRGDARIALVPTMGALHAGHLSLVDLAAALADVVVVSIFVNPMQFDRSDDFEAYPRPIEADVAVLGERRVDAVYAPTRAAMYPTGFDTTVVPGVLATTMEGVARPGHFTGVTTVVTKLLAAVRPHLAVFGEKDFQQLAIIRRMAADLDLGVEIVAAPIVREPDGLALSSRNGRLSPADRRAAAVVPSALEAAAAAYTAGERAPRRLEGAAESIVAGEPAARLEYVTVFDPVTLAPLADGETPADDTRIATAVWFGDVRLIDNRPLAG
jgi:pantoate--beta-alanine ligase